MSSATAPKTILLRGEPLALEGVGSGAILPGHILERDSGGTVSVHSTDGGDARPLLVAREEEYCGGAIDTSYADGDNIPYYVMRPGDQFYAILDTSQVVTIGTLLESNGNGRLSLIGTAGTGIVRALEAVTTVGSTARIRVEAL